MSTFDYDKAAAVLVDAAYQGDEAAAEQWRLSKRTIRNYRARMDDDAQLAALFHDKRRLVERDWSASLPAALRAGTEFLMRAAKQGNPRDPNMVNAVAGATRQVAEIYFVKQMLDLRLRNDERDTGDAGTVRPQIAEMVVIDGEFRADEDA